MHASARGGIMPDRILYLEPFSGISGDMTVGALLDLGGDFEALRQTLALLPVTGYTLSRARCSRAGIGATKFDVELPASHEHGHGHGHKHGHGEHAHGHRTFRDIRALIESSSMSPWVRQKSLEAFRRLAEAEGAVHGQAPDDVHFHEVGAVDSIVDIVGSMVLLEALMPARIVSGPVNVGQGTLECRHGRYPVPGPAVQELLKGVPTYSGPVQGELTTPTGAALLACLVESYGERPESAIVQTGYGAGTRDTPGSANVLRITVAEAVKAAHSPEEEVAVLEATIDDMSPQIYGYFLEKALAAGALDVYAGPVQMKKNRPGMIVTVVCAPQDVERLALLIFSETTTIGLRYTFARRKTLSRDFVVVKTEFGPVTMKVSSFAGEPLNFVPEYEDCRRIAEAQGVALKRVVAAATHAYLGSDAPKSE